MKALLLLDSVILIDHLNQCPQATQYLEMVESQAVISVITRAEVLAGIHEEPSLQRVKTFLDHFIALEITKPVADLAAQLRREQKWKLPDALQAALAKYHHLSLVTRNTKDFPPAKYDFVVVPYTF